MIVIIDGVEYVPKKDQMTGLKGGVWLTVAEVCSALKRQRDLAAHVYTVRRVIDDLESQDRIKVQRMGQYRTVSSEDIGLIGDALASRGKRDT